MNKNQDQSHVMTIKIDTENMTAQQKRAIRTINTLLCDLAITSSEEDYFNNASEIIKLVASLVKIANFAQAHKDDAIPYAIQALELAIENTAENLLDDKMAVYDN